MLMKVDVPAMVSTCGCLSASKVRDFAALSNPDILAVNEVLSDLCILVLYDPAAQLSEVRHVK
jgi:hypothetical protein